MQEASSVPVRYGVFSGTETPFCDIVHPETSIVNGKSDENKRQYINLRDRCRILGPLTSPKLQAGLHNDSPGHFLSRAKDVIFPCLNFMIVAESRAVNFEVLTITRPATSLNTEQFSGSLTLKERAQRQNQASDSLHPTTHSRRQYNTYLILLLVCLHGVSLPAFLDGGK